MSVVRELIARLGFQVDKSGFQEAEKALDHVRKSVQQTGVAIAKGGGAAGPKGAAGAAAAKAATASSKAAAAAAAGAAASGDNALKTLGKAAAAVGLTHVIESIVEMASSAQETSSAINALFGAEGQKQVTDWAERTAVEMGRSKYAMQKFVGTLGAVATPMLGNADRAREMSESYAELAVDMASFYNSSDEDALAALRSAMTGEVESIKRYGVVMNDATMQEYAHSVGIKKKISAMTIAEKTELRYGFVMKATAAAHGDAARTGAGFANSMRRVQALMLDLGTDMGTAVLPKIETLLHFITDGIAGFKEFTKGTALLSTAMWVLGGVAAALAFQLLAPFILPAIAIAALILLIDDLYGLFTGGKSAIGDFIDSMFGLGATEDMVNSLRDAWQWLSETFTELSETMPDITGMFEVLMGVGEDFGLAVSRWEERLARFIATVQNLPKILGKKVASALGFKVDQDDAEGRAAGRGLGAGTMSVSEEAAAGQAERETRIRSGVAGRDEARQKRNAERQRKGLVVTTDKNIEETEKKLKENLSKEDRAKAEEFLAGARKQRDELRAAEPVFDPLARRSGVARTRAQQAAAAAAPNASLPAEIMSVGSPASVSAPLSSEPMSSAPPVVQQTNATTINISGGNLNEVRKVVQETINANNRRAAAAIPRAGGA
jgi:hypothetical protein